MALDTSTVTPFTAALLILVTSNIHSNIIFFDMSVGTYSHESSNGDTGGEEETSQPHDQKPAADVLKSFRESFELIKSLQQEGVL